MSSSKMIASFAMVVYFAVCVSSLQYQTNKKLENDYIAKYGAGKPVKWDALSKLGPEGRAEVCKSVHEKTGFGVLKDEGLKGTTMQNAFLKFSSPKVKKTFTQVLGCAKNNEEKYVYYLTQGLEKDSVMLVYPTQDAKIKGKSTFTFTKRDQITEIPILKKFVPSNRKAAAAA